MQRHRWLAEQQTVSLPQLQPQLPLAYAICFSDCADGRSSIICSYLQLQHNRQHSSPAEQISHWHWHKRTPSSAQYYWHSQRHLLYNNRAPIDEYLLIAPASQAYVERILQPVWLYDCWSSQQNETVSWTPRLSEVKFPYMILKVRSTMGSTEWAGTKS